jgi:oxygen-independent coproporphyrinogen-3 oxidase
MSLVTPPLSLYVHLPWCVRKCPYCDFNSHEKKGVLPFGAYIDALIADLDQDLPLAWGRVVHSVFFGGGTPSLFPPEAIDAFLQQASARLRFAPGLEITLETNPGTAEHGRFEGYRAAGVNRLSFGIQSFDDACLQRLGRIHDSREADSAVKLAQDAGYDNINLDLMYALPGQTLEMAVYDVERALARCNRRTCRTTSSRSNRTRCSPRARRRAFPASTKVGTSRRPARRGSRRRASSTTKSRRTRSPGGSRSTTSITGASAITSASAPARTASSRWAHRRTCCAGGRSSIPPSTWPRAGTPGSIGGDETLTPQRLPFDYMLNALRLHEGFRSTHSKRAPACRARPSRPSWNRRANGAGSPSIPRVTCGRPSWAGASPTT